MSMRSALGFALATILVTLTFKDIAAARCGETVLYKTFLGRESYFFNNSDQCKYELAVRPLTTANFTSTSFVVFNGPDCLSRRAFFSEFNWENKITLDGTNVSGVFVDHGNLSPKYDVQIATVPKRNRSTQPPLYDYSTYVHYDKCGETLSAKEGEIKLDKYLYNGRQSAFCVWRIVTGSGGKVTLSDIKFSLSTNQDLYVFDGDNCNGNVILFQSVAIAPNINTVTSSGSAMTIMFWSPAGLNTNSFSAKFQTTGGVVPVNPPEDYAYPEEIMKTIGLTLPKNLTSAARRNISNAIGDADRENLLFKTASRRKLFTAIRENVNPGAREIIKKLKEQFAELAKKLPPSSKRHPKTHLVSARSAMVSTL